MFQNLTVLLAADCEVVEFSNGEHVYPIFKNGRSSLTRYQRKNNLKLFKNEEISTLKKVTVFLRPPKERFVSGVYTFFYLTNQLINKQSLQKINNFDVIDRHFMPQYLWLLHLYKYFSGVVNFKPVSLLYDLIPNRNGPWDENPKPWKPISQEIKNEILSISNKKYIEVDEKIIETYMNQSVELKKIIKEFKKHALSAT